MGNKIIKGKIQNLETGEVFGMSHYLFCGGLELNAIVQIQHIESYTHPDNSIQICIDCLALDSIGGVFDLGLNFTPEDNDNKIKILSDITVGTILSVRGEYTVLSEANGGITLHDPQYSQLPPDFSRDEVEEVFRVNSSEYENRKAPNKRLDPNRE